MSQAPYNAPVGLSAVHINTAVTTTVKAVPGMLGGIYVNTNVAGTVTVYDSLTATGTILAVITVTTTLPATGVLMLQNINFKVGLTIVTSATADLTVVFR